MNNLKPINVKAAIKTSLLALLLLSTSSWLFAQEGHPLNGTWSGDRESNGTKVRLLLIMNLQPNQEIVGTLIENGVRYPLTNISLDPVDWRVTLIAQGKNRDGEMVIYTAEGVIKNLGSASDRTIVGTWQTGNKTDSFSVRMN